MDLQSMQYKDLLKIANDDAISGTGKFYWAESGGPVPKTLFKKPATAKQITKLEEHLGVTLPEDYKEFLCISNGFGSDGENGISNGYCPDPELFSTDKVNWISESYLHVPIELLDLPYEITKLCSGRKKTDTPDTFSLGTGIPLFDRVLQIGTRDVVDVWLVRPDLVERARAAYLHMYIHADDRQRLVIDKAIERFAGGREAFKNLEWCCVRRIVGGGPSTRGFPGFRSYIERTVEEAQKVTTE